MVGYYLFNKNEQRKVLQKYIFNVNLIIEVLNMENNKKGLEKKRQKSNKKIWIIISIVIAILILGIVIYVIFLEYNCNKNNNKKNYGYDIPTSLPVTYKPIIYLYSEKETNVSVNLGNFKNITCSYPLYKKSGWQIKANKNGDLVDLETGRNLYALYYENKNAIEFKIKDEGFIVKSTDTINFLEEKLQILGLNEREIEEFIIYWLPVLQKNEYNYIRFASSEEINKNMPLNVEPNPDTTIRVLMTYKGLKEPIDIKEQKLVTPNREGFTVVEWGGTEIK